MRAPTLVLAAALLGGTASAATHPPGATLEKAAVVDITAAGFEALDTIIPTLIPDVMPIDGMSDEYEGAFGQCWLGGYAYSLSNMWVGIEVADTRIVPQTGYLDVAIDLYIWVNDASDPFDLYTELECIGDTCHGHVDPFLATITTTMALDIGLDGDGLPVLDATVGDLVLDYDLSGDDITLDDCVIGGVEDVLNFFGLSLYDFILGLADGAINDALTGFADDLETTIEDMGQDLYIYQEVDVQGTVIQIELFPSDLEISTAGVRVFMNGSVAAGQVAECIEEYDPHGSLATASDPIPVGVTPSGITAGHHAAFELSDDFGNQALYGLWAGGLLCYTLTPEDGIPLDTAILGLLAGDAFDELFPETEPVILQTRPRVPLELDYAQDADVTVAVDDLGLEFYSKVDGRMALVLGMNIDMDVGADLLFDGSTGELEVALDLGIDEMQATVRDNELVPDASADIESNFTNTFETLAGSLIGGLLEGLAFGLPSMSGIGLQQLEITATGTNEDWLGAFAWVGPVGYAGSSSSGCGCGGSDTGVDTGGASSGGCGGTSCAVAPLRSRVALFALPLALALIRRRRS